MQINLIGCLFVLQSEKNINIRKSDIKSIKVLVDKNNSLPEIRFNGGNMKSILKKHLKDIIGSNIFHLEQVFTMSYEDSLDIIYLGITNIENIVKLNKDYELKIFKIKDNNTLTFGSKTFKYKTVEIEKNKNIEFFHEIDTKDNSLKRNLLNLLISYKKIRQNIDNSDIIFKFMGDSFTLEDVRILYELIKDTTVDKSNFRKKIIKYCEIIEGEEQTKKGFRPSKKYRFKPLKGDIWL